MTSGEEIVPHFITTSNQCVRPEESKPAVPILTWLSRKARMAGTACLATLSQPAVGPLLIACVCLGTLAYKKCNCRPKPVLHRSVSMAALHGGRAILERILDAQGARIHTAGLDGAIKEMETIISKRQIDFQDLYRAAIKLEMSGKEEDAIKLLAEALQKAQINKQFLEAYEFEMLLVEMLIYKGDFDNALKCKCLMDSDISDARIPLYKAILHIILNNDKNNDNARNFFEKFQSICKSFHWPDSIEEGSPLYWIVHKFDEFEKIVQNLKKEIDHAHNLKTSTAN